MFNKIIKFFKNTQSTLLINVYLILTFLVFVYGSIGGELITPIFLTFALNTFFVGLLLLNGYKLSIPSGFILFLIFLIILFIQTHLANGRYLLAWLFTSGASFWLTFFNIKDKVAESFFNLLYLLAVVMTLLFLFTIGTNISSDVTENLFHPTASSLHNHLGDIVAISLIPLTTYLTRAQKIVYLVFFVGVILVALSYSRSAILAFLVSFVYLKYFSDKGKNTDTIIKTAFFSMMLFILFGFSKTTFSARPYYLQAISLIPSHWQGIGVGNFGNFFGPAQLVHSLVLEIVTGMGIFSIIFIAWLSNTVRKFTRNPRVLLFEAVFLGILINLTFDRTYLVPSMIWIWFCTLGMIGLQESKKEQFDKNINRSYND